MMNFLPDLSNVSNRVAATQTGFERLDRSFAFMLNPSLVAGVATVDLGSPATGERVQGELWADALCAVWRCTVAGEPGTWQQITEPVVADATARDAITGQPAGYRVLTADDGARWMWDGATWDAI